MRKSRLKLNSIRIFQESKKIRMSSVLDVAEIKKASNEDLFDMIDFMHQSLKIKIISMKEFFAIKRYIMKEINSRENINDSRSYYQKWIGGLSLEKRLFVEGFFDELNKE